MIESHCENCYLFEVCCGDKPCESFDSCEEIVAGKYIDEIIENGRYEFRKAWFKYIEDWNE